MKKYTFAFVLISLALVSCKQKGIKTAVVTPTVKANHQKINKANLVNYSTPLLKQYDAFVSSLSITKIDNSTIAGKQYQELFKSAPVKICDTALIIFDTFYEKMANGLDESSEKENMHLDKYYAYSDSKKKVSGKVTNYVKYLKQNGFALREEEGSMYIVEDRDFIASQFYTFISAPMKQYLIQLNKENKNIYAEDASIVIDYKELVERAIWWEQFVKNRPVFPYQKQALSMKSTYLELLLEGSENTWILEPETKKLDTYFGNAYAFLEKEYPSSETGKTVIPYYHLLAAQQIAKADSLLKDLKKKNIISDDGDPLTD